MIIDGHTHIHPRIDGFGENRNASVAALIDGLRNGPISKAIVLPIAPEISNEFVAEACREYPDILTGFASVEPLLGDVAIEQFERAIFDLGLRGLKLHPRRQKFGHNEFVQIIPLIKKTVDLKVPVLIDAFPYGQGFFDRREVQLVNDMAVAVPHAKIILAHAGGYQIFDALMVAKANPNVFLDISFTPLYFRGTSIERDLGFVIRKMGGERIIYGSDHPDTPILTAFEQMMEVLNGYGLTEAHMEAVLGNNLAELLSWT
jgi:predicted TIM-barrel fold metal-dependent hydrolase